MTEIDIRLGIRNIRLTTSVQKKWLIRKSEFGMETARNFGSRIGYMKQQGTIMKVKEKREFRI